MVHDGIATAQRVTLITQLRDDSRIVTRSLIAVVVEPVLGHSHLVLLHLKVQDPPLHFHVLQITTCVEVRVGESRVTNGENGTNNAGD